MDEYERSEHSWEATYRVASPKWGKHGKGDESCTDGRKTRQPVGDGGAGVLGQAIYVVLVEAEIDRSQL